MASFENLSIHHTTIGTPIPKQYGLVEFWVQNFLKIEKVVKRPLKVYSSNCLVLLYLKLCPSSLLPFFPLTLFLEEVSENVSVKVRTSNQTRVVVEP